MRRLRRRQFIRYRLAWDRPGTVRRLRVLQVQAARAYLTRVYGRASYTIIA